MRPRSSKKPRKAIAAIRLVREWAVGVRGLGAQRPGAEHGGAPSRSHGTKEHPVIGAGDSVYTGSCPDLEVHEGIVSFFEEAVCHEKVPEVVGRPRVFASVERLVGKQQLT